MPVHEHGGQIAAFNAVCDQERSASADRVVDDASREAKTLRAGQ